MRSKAPGMLGAVFALLGACFAQGSLDSVQAAITTLCFFLTDLLPPLSMALTVCGGAVYAAGQILGAESRSRAATWASAMLIGALVMVIIATVAPPVLSAIYGCELICGGAVIGVGGC